MQLSRALYEINFQAKYNQGGLYEQTLSVRLQNKVVWGSGQLFNAFPLELKELQSRDSKYLWNECHQVV